MIAGHDIHPQSHVLSGENPDMQDLRTDLHTFKENLGDGETALPSFPCDVFDVSTRNGNKSSPKSYPGTRLSQPADEMMVDAPNKLCSWELAPEFSSTPLYDHGPAISDQEFSCLSTNDPKPSGDCEILPATEICFGMAGISHSPKFTPLI